MLGRFNGIDILFIALIGIYLIALIFLIFYLGSLFFDKADQKRQLAKTSTLKLSLEKEEVKEEVKMVKPVKTKNKSLVNEDKVQTKKTTKNKSKKESASNKTKEQSKVAKTKETGTKNKTTNSKKKNNATNKNNGYRQATKKKSNSRKKKKKNNNKRKKK